MRAKNTYAETVIFIHPVSNYLMYISIYASGGFVTLRYEIWWVGLGMIRLMESLYVGVVERSVEDVSYHTSLYVEKYSYPFLISRNKIWVFRLKIDHYFP